MNWVKVFGPEILREPDFLSEVKANGKRLCLIKSQGKFHATQYYCPHAGASLAFGRCKEGKLICPHHRYEYDIETGRGNPGQGDYITVYLTEIRDDGVFVGLPEPCILGKIFG